MSQNDNIYYIVHLTLEYASLIGNKLEKTNLDLENLQNKFNSLQNKMDEEKRYKTVGIETEQGTYYTRVEYESDDESYCKEDATQRKANDEEILITLKTVKTLLEDLKTHGVKFRNIKSFWAQLNEKIEGKKRKRKSRSKRLKKAYKDLSTRNTLSNPVTSSN